MSYTLEDLVNAINRRQLQQQQQQQQQQQRLYRSTPQYRIVPNYAFGPYQNIYAGGYDDESDDDDYQPIYPAYYGTPYNSLPIRPQNIVRTSQRQQQQPQQAQQAQHHHHHQSEPQQQQTDGVDTLFDILSKLVGPPIADAVDVDDDEKEKEKHTKDNDDAKKNAAASEPEKLKASQESSESAKSELDTGNEADEKLQEASKEKESESQIQTPASAASASASSPHPRLKKTHSTVHFEEPKPKIELSQRNVRDQSIPFSPQTNIYESNESYDIIMAIPGASIKNLDIDFHPSTNELVVKGNVPNTANIFGSNSSSEPTLKVDEIRTGSIERRIKFPNLPKIVDEQIKAKYINGLLTIRIPKNLESEKQKVKRRVTIEDVPDEELLFEEKGGLV